MDKNQFLVKIRELKEKMNTELDLAHWKSGANFYPPERQLTKASEPLFDLEGRAQGQI